jgi:hypothetical protein
MAYPPISNLPSPPSRQDPANFTGEADAFLGALPTFQTQVNAAGTYIDGVGTAVDADATAAAASASTAQAAATTAVNAVDASEWTSGGSFTKGDVVWSGVDFGTYRAILTHTGVATDPSADATNWVLISSPVKASQAEAEAGTDNTKFLTPLRTAEAIAALVPIANLPPLAGRALDAVRVNAAANGFEFADVTAAGWALLDDADAAAQRVTLGVPPINSPTFTGTPSAPTAAAATNTTQIATTEFVTTANNLKANLASPTFTGTPTAPTAAAATNTTQIATTAMVRLAIPNVLNASGTAPLFACRAWVNFNGTGTVAIRASGNVSSITDNGGGDYTVNFTTAMPDANYGCQVTAGNSGTLASGNCGIGWAAFYAVGSVRIGLSDNNTDSNTDFSNTNVAIFR